MRTARIPNPAGRFLGVRLSAEESELLEQFRETHGSASRSDAVRALVRGATATDVGAPELPTGLSGQLEEIVEDGWANNVDEALTLVVTLGLQELSRVHGERKASLGDAARRLAARRAERRRADREGRGLLGR